MKPLSLIVSVLVMLLMMTSSAFADQYGCERKADPGACINAHEVLKQTFIDPFKRDADDAQISFGMSEAQKIVWLQTQLLQGLSSDAVDELRNGGDWDDALEDSPYRVRIQTIFSQQYNCRDEDDMKECARLLTPVAIMTLGYMKHQATMPQRASLSEPMRRARDVFLFREGVRIVAESMDEATLDMARDVMEDINDEAGTDY